MTVGISAPGAIPIVEAAAKLLAQDIAVITGVSPIARDGPLFTAPWIAEADGLSSVGRVHGFQIPHMFYQSSYASYPTNNSSQQQQQQQSFGYQPLHIQPNATTFQNIPI